MKAILDLSQLGTLLRCATLALALAALPIQAGAQDDVSVSSGALDGLSASCTSASNCQGAVSALIADIAAASPDVPIGEVIGEVASALAAAYNRGEVSASVMELALEALASIAESLGLTQLASSIRDAVADVAAGNPIDVEAVAEGSASPT